MSDLEAIPLYKLSVVLEETNLSADTVRVWEKRYGLPQPQRTAGGHRLYSRRDIRTLQWLAARQAEGLRISQAVALWQDLTAKGQDPLSTPTRGQPTPLDAIRTDWLHACLDFDEARADAVLEAAFAAAKAERVGEKVLLSGLREIGGMWYRGEASIQQEHFTAEHAFRHLHTRLSNLPLSKEGPTVLVATPPREQHAFPALFIAFLLRQRGVQVLFLGADVPLSHLSDTIRKTQAAMLILSAQQLHTAVSLVEVAETLRSTQVLMAYGGQIFNQHTALQRRVPAFFLGETIPTAAEQAFYLLRAAPSDVAYSPPLSHYLALASMLVYNRSMLEGYVSQAMQTVGMSAEETQTANFFMGENLHAALQLGDLAFLDDEIIWLEGLLQYRRRPAEWLSRYLEAWKQALHLYLGANGAPITDWLTHQMATI